MARMTLTDFDAELVARGFDAFPPADRQRYINWGYRRIARRARWLWEQTSATVNMVAGATGIGAWANPVDSSHPIGNLKSITKVYITSPTNLRSKLRPLSDDEFFENWFVLDLNDLQSRATPEGYYLWENSLWIIPPPDLATTVVVHYKQQVTDLIAPTDSPITPPDLDEAIVTAALTRTHKRANELGLSQQSTIELEEVFADMATDESFIEEEQPSRVSPDDQWL
jgi:hypothetical protein